MILNRDTVNAEAMTSYPNQTDVIAATRVGASLDFRAESRVGCEDRARYYHPQLQRFISEDPFGLAGGDINAFAYVLNNPLAFSDPFGLKVLFETAAVIPPNAEVMGKLEELNRLIPDRDIILTSGSEPRRNPTKGSRHPLGTAADIKIPGLTSAEVAELGAQIGFIGISTYDSPPGHTHVDIGPRDREWNAHNGFDLKYRPNWRINGERKGAHFSKSAR